MINESRLEILMNTIQIGAGLIIVLCRTLVIGWNYEKLMNLRRYLNSRKFYREDEVAFKIRRKVYLFIHRIVLLFVINSCLMTAPIFIIQPTAPLRIPFKFGSYVLDIVAQKIYLLMIIQIVIDLATNFFVIVMLLTGLTAECEILSKAVAELFKTTILKLETTGPSRSSSRTLDEQFWTTLNHQFDKCIVEHRTILRHLIDIRPLLEGSFLITYYTATLNIAAGAFFLISNLDHINLYIYQICHYTIVLTLECFVFTFFTTKLSDAYKSIGQSAHEMDWPDHLQHSHQFERQYRAVRAKILIMMTVGSQEVRFSAGGYFEFTQEKFTDLMNKSYSMIMFLWEMRK
ncbi:hypothetical protein RP20_CCG000278 [Aedes albopictus]|nr:hypothetical protein RP20_CCG000278 [Aedes albopictus]